MNNKLHNTLCLLVLFSASLLRAETLFEENFDNSPPYSDGGPLPEEPGAIRYGQWNVSPESVSRVTTPADDTAPSLPRVLAIEGRDDERSSVSFKLGFPDHNAIETTEALRIRAAVLVSAASSAEVLLYGGDRFLGYAQIVVNESGSGYARAWFGGTASEDKIPISEGTWYVLEMRFPESPNPESQYEFRMYESDGTTQIGDTSFGRFYTPPEGLTAYKSVTLNSERARGNVRFDNILVETLLPDPSPGHEK